MSEIPKAYEPQSVESKWYQFWLDRNCFTANPHSAKPAYSIVIPPPNVTGVLTLGHVLNNTIQDILARKARMDGKEVLWLPGTDHAGIATERQVEKAVKKEEKKSKQELGREEFIKRVWAWQEKHGGIILQQLKALGASCDWTRTRFTADPEYSRCVARVFVDLYKKGCIYRGKRMVNWCPVSLTALSDEEVIMKEQKGALYYFKVEVAEQPGTFLTIVTTRPETIPGDTAVAVNPKDTRYAHLIGKRVVRALPAELPREEKLIPIIGDEHVDFEFGTGVLKVTPAHDKADFEIGQRHGLRVVDIMNPDATMNDLAGGDLRGLDRFKARKVAVEKLAEIGALEKEEPYTNNVGFSERADVPIEPRLSEQWFLKYPSVEKARACVALGSTGYQPVSSGDSPEGTGEGSRKQSSVTSGSSASSIPVGGSPVPPTEKMHFYPPRWAKVYDHWMGNIQDWCISRQLWWGHRIPVWYRQFASNALSKSTLVVFEDWNRIAGTKASEMRERAIELARSRGILNSEFRNLDTGWEIYIQKSSLEHAFANPGLANIKLVPALPELLRHAIYLYSAPHAPVSPDVKAVHVFVGALLLGHTLFRVKFTVKEFASTRKLYDHQSLEVWRETNEPGGKYPPEAHSVAGELAPRPAPGSRVTIADLLFDVNRDQHFTRCQISSPGADWTQDPDVLDTWFSSWLWPFATMGWPEQTDTLKKFYPTTDLVTGPDIIFFWVARMIMAGYEYMGEMPFRNVYFTGIIRDKLGRKMSKSLGNSPDPLDLITKYGADALRFGIMRSAPQGQDLLFDEQSVELGRNFCNKLWNACRFRQMQEGASEGEIDARLLKSDDKWVLLKLDQAIREVTVALADYRFNEATQTLYRFFWSEYCDWYVEASKAVFQGGNAAQKTNTLAVIDFVLSHTLRLLHPFLPFITEELWHGMGYDNELPPEQGGDSIMFAHWPKELGTEFKEFYGLDDCYHEFVDAKYELVSLGRNLRREARVTGSKRVKFILKPTEALAPHDAEVLKLLLNAESLELIPEFVPGKGTPGVHSKLGELYLPTEGLVDVGAERARLQKELEKISLEIEKVLAKLQNPSFVSKVPPHVLEEHQKRLADWEAKKQHAERARESLAENS